MPVVAMPPLPSLDTPPSHSCLLLWLSGCGMEQDLVRHHGAARNRVCPAFQRPSVTNYGRNDCAADVHPRSARRPSPDLPLTAAAPLVDRGVGRVVTNPGAWRAFAAARQGERGHVSHLLHPRRPIALAARRRYHSSSGSLRNLDRHLSYDHKGGQRTATHETSICTQTTASSGKSPAA